MKYPDDFNTPAFPAGKFVAVSRFMATAVMLLFFVIICLCGIILWAKTSQSSSPFLVSIRPNGERWAMVEHNNHRTEIPAYYVMQEALLNKFARDWFTISEDSSKNQAIWSGNCDRTGTVCREAHNTDVDTCAIYCVCNDAVFESFKTVVLPTYSKIEAKPNTVWNVREIYVSPVSAIQKSGGLWRLNVIVKPSNLSTSLRFIVYVDIEQDTEVYGTKNLGYYIADFNAYRMN